MNWHAIHMEMAQVSALNSTDRSTKIGCAIVNPADQSYLAVGCNRFPKGLPDHDVFHERPAKYTLTIHAEMNAIASAARNNGQLNGALLYSSMFPCSRCAVMIIETGIASVVSYEIRDERNLRLTSVLTRNKWIEEAELAHDILKLAGVNIVYLP